jgi:hypothetical protein
MQNACEDSAARTEADDVRILKDCPCGSKPVEEKQDLSRASPPEYPALFQFPVMLPSLRNNRAALTATKV